MRAVIDLNILSCGEAVAEIKPPHSTSLRGGSTQMHSAGQQRKRRPRGRVEVLYIPGARAAADRCPPLASHVDSTLWLSPLECRPVMGGRMVSFVVDSCRFIGRHR
ncbi:hypothetical protein BHE74_00006781 [Ensete ventricosum]|nr:hypothetical protein BHE74_00006781 [Ensete ventricosum]